MHDLELTIIIVTYNSASVIGPCLDSIFRQLQGVEHETIVVDNGSTDGTREQVERRPWTVFLESGGNIGFAAANNLAARQAQGRYLLLLNPDTLLLPGAVEIMLSEIETQPDVGVVGACHVDGRGELARCWGDFPDFWWVFANQAPWKRVGITLVSNKVLGRTCEGVTGTREADWVSGACFMVPASLWNQLDGLDEDFFLYFEETDFCSRAWRAGRRVVLVPSATIVHLEGTAVGQQSVTQAVRLMEGLFLFLRKRDGVVAGLGARCWIWVVNLVLWASVFIRGHSGTQDAARFRGLMRAALTPRPERPGAEMMGQ